MRSRKAPPAVPASVGSPTSVSLLPVSLPDPLTLRLAGWTPRSDPSPSATCRGSSDRRRTPSSQRTRFPRPAPRASKSLACVPSLVVPRPQVLRGYAQSSSREAPIVSLRLLSRNLHHACLNRVSLLRRTARPQVEIGRRRIGELPVDVRLLLQLVVGVGRFDSSLERAIERREVLLLDRRLERLPVLGEVLVDRGLVLWTHERAHLEEADDLLVLELGHRPVIELGGVVELPCSRPDLGHDACQAWLDRGHVLDGHRVLAAPEGHRLDLLLELLVVHALVSQRVSDG